MSERREFHLDNIPKGGIIDQYLNKLQELARSKKMDLLDSCLRGLFEDCICFLEQRAIMSRPYNIRLSPLHREQYEQREQSAEKIAKQIEKAESASSGFSLGNKEHGMVCVNLDALIDLLPCGYITFIIYLTLIYIHELLHLAFPTKKEQEIHEMECSLTEQFLQIVLPNGFKRLRASDFYHNNE